MKLADNPQLSRSILALIGANVIAMALALIEGWRLQELVIIYWAQSVIIGFFSVLRLLALREYSNEGLQQFGNSIAASQKSKYGMALFFALHYGGFHFAYLIFIFKDGDDALSGNPLYLLLCVAVFLVNHFFSFVANREEDLKKKPNIRTIMYFPYLRIIPMHLTIMAGGFFGHAGPVTLLVFLILKTIADVKMHKVEHSGWQRSIPHT